MVAEGLLRAGDEARLVEAAWAPLGTEVNRVRHVLTTRPAGHQADGLAMLTGATETFVASLTGQCRELTGGELTSLDRVTERKLYDIDSAALHAVTNCSPTCDTFSV